MTKDINTLREELTTALDDQGIKADDWSDDYDIHLIRNAIDQVGGIEIGLDIIGSESGATIAVMYYSNKIHRSIILDFDCYHSHERTEDLAEMLMNYEEEAATIEASITV